MHRQQLQVKLWSHYAASSTGFGKQLQAWDRKVRPAQVDAHQPRKNHSAKSGEQGERVILLADHFMIEAEDVFAKETRRWGVVLCHMYCRVVHILTST
jgi:hypothetical protein